MLTRISPFPWGLSTLFYGGNSALSISPWVSLLMESSLRMVLLSASLAPSDLLVTLRYASRRVTWFLLTIFYTYIWKLVLHSQAVRSSRVFWLLSMKVEKYFSGQASCIFDSCVEWESVSISEHSFTIVRATSTFLYDCQSNFDCCYIIRRAVSKIFEWRIPVNHPCLLVYFSFLVLWEWELQRKEKNICERKEMQAFTFHLYKCLHEVM